MYRKEKLSLLHGHYCLLFSVQPAYLLLIPEFSTRILSDFLTKLTRRQVLLDQCTLLHSSDNYKFNFYVSIIVGVPDSKEKIILHAGNHTNTVQLLSLNKDSELQIRKKWRVPLIERNKLQITQFVTESLS